MNYYNIIPRPENIELRQGVFVLRHDSAINYADEAAKHPAEMLAGYLRPATGYALPVKTFSSSPDIIILSASEGAPELGSEGYTLEVTQAQIIIRANESAGLFYGVQTLRQLLSPAVFSPFKEDEPWSLPCVKITDRPRFRWRGIMFDEGRHWFGKEYVKRFIDLISLHKYNVFHWHLTENAGWRIDIRRYPKLREIAAWRDKTVIGRADRKPREFDNKPYGGFYTQDDVREIVEYASAHFIKVVPEIEMPGHCQAALAAYPELGCTGGPYEVMNYWDYSDNNFCAGNDAVFEFLNGVLDEICELFPSKYIHIGGDECRKTAWENCPKCRKRMKDENLSDGNKLQSYFIRRIEKYLSSKGRSIVGWDEILEGGPEPNALVMFWLEKASSLEAAVNAHHHVIASLHQYTYFDYYQGDPAKEPLAIGGMLPLEKVYSFEPVPQGVPAGMSKYVIGVQGQIWSQYIKERKHLEYMTFPRACALAEVAWSLPEKDYNGFLRRLVPHLARLDSLDVRYRKLD